jgi:hypothetical protein
VDLVTPLERRLTYYEEHDNRQENKHASQTNPKDCGRITTPGPKWSKD